MRDFYEEITQNAKSVTTTAEELTGNVNTHDRTATILQNLGADVLYIGDDTVTSSDGIKLNSGDDFTIEGPARVWGVSVGTSDVRILELE